MNALHNVVRLVPSTAPSPLPPNGRCTLDFTKAAPTKRSELHSSEAIYRATDHSRLDRFEDEIDSLHPAVGALTIVTGAGLFWLGVWKLGAWLCAVLA